MPKGFQCGSQPISWKWEIDIFFKHFQNQILTKPILWPHKWYKKDPLIHLFMIQSVHVQKWSTPLVHFSEHKFALLNGWA